jgi:hypothetical protein
LNHQAEIRHIAGQSFPRAQDCFVALPGLFRAAAVVFKARGAQVGHEVEKWAFTVRHAQKAGSSSSESISARTAHDISAAE